MSESLGRRGATGVITITRVKVILHQGDRIRGYATITIDGSFVVRGIKIIEGENGHLFAAMPSRKRSDGTYQDLAHPISGEARHLVEEAVRAEYLKQVEVERDGECYWHVRDSHSTHPDYHL